MSKTNDKPTAAELRQAIETERQERAAACLEAINNALKFHNCILLPVLVARGNQVEQKVEVVAND